MGGVTFDGVDERALALESGFFDTPGLRGECSPWRERTRGEISHADRPQCVGSISPERRDDLRSVPRRTAESRCVTNILNQRLPKFEPGPARERECACNHRGIVGPAGRTATRESRLDL